MVCSTNLLKTQNTHVFVSDPTQGYGLYIDWMLQKETEIAEGA